MPRVLALSATELDQRIQLQAISTAKDARGQTVETWVNDGSVVWARARTVSASLTIQANSGQSQDLVVFAIRYRTGLTDQKRRRVLWRGAPYDLIGIPANIDGGNHTLEMTCVGGKPT